MGTLTFQQLAAEHKIFEALGNEARYAIIKAALQKPEGITLKILEEDIRGLDLDAQTLRYHLGVLVASELLECAEGPRNLKIYLVNSKTLKNLAWRISSWIPNL